MTSGSLYSRQRRGAGTLRPSFRSSLEEVLRCHVTPNWLELFQALTYINHKVKTYCLMSTISISDHYDHSATAAVLGGAGGTPAFRARRKRVRDLAASLVNADPRDGEISWRRPGGTPAR